MTVRRSRVGINNSRKYYPYSTDYHAICVVDHTHAGHMCMIFVYFYNLGGGGGGGL